LTDCPFAMIPVEVYDLHDGHALAVYAALAKFANRDGVCWPSMKAVADLTGWHVQTCRKAIGKLVEAGLVTIEARQLHGMDQANRYLLSHHNIEQRRVVMSSPAVVTRSPLGGDDITSGWGPDHHELEPVELEPKELRRQNGVKPPPRDYDFRPTYRESLGSAWPVFRDQFKSLHPDLTEGALLTMLADIERDVGPLSADQIRQGLGIGHRAIQDKLDAAKKGGRPIEAIRGFTRHVVTERLKEAATT
jgi:hypothetical protein